MPTSSSDMTLCRYEVCDPKCMWCQVSYHQLRHVQINGSLRRNCPTSPPSLTIKLVETII